MSREIPTGHKPEALPPKERWQASFSVVTISGLPGCGNTILARSLTKKYGVELVTVGQLLRERIEESNSPVINYINRPVEVDRELDGLQAKKIKQAIEMTNNPIIVEAKLAGVIATGVLNQTPPKQQALSPVLRILVVADDNVRAERVSKREKKKNPDLEISSLEILEQTQNREKRDLIRYRTLHPQLADIDPWDIANKDRFYDFVIDTTKLSKEDEVRIAHENLVTRGLVKRI